MTTKVIKFVLRFLRSFTGNNQLKLDPLNIESN
jgi:hypothetical protein